MHSLPSSTLTCRTDAQFIAEQLCQFARMNLVADGADFNEHSPLAAAGIDSFSMVELLLFSERTYGISVPASHLTHEHLASLSALARCIARLADGSASALRGRS